MPIELYRVDERLIHGQVVVGWGARLRPQRYVVVDEELAFSEWERELYALGLPDDVEAVFVSPETAREALPSWRESESRTVLLTRDVQTMLEIAAGGLMEGETVNLGGLHAREGKREVLPYLYLGGGDREALRALEREGVRVSARDLPGSPAVSLDSLLV